MRQSLKDLADIETRIKSQTGLVLTQLFSQQPQLAFQMLMHQFQPQGMGMLFGQSYPQYFQSGMGNFLMFQMPSNMSGRMFAITPHMWIQPSVQPAAPPPFQPALMEVNKDTSCSQEMKSSSSSSKKKSKEKAKASKAFTHQQQVEEEEENLNQLL